MWSTTSRVSINQITPLLPTLEIHTRANKLDQIPPPHLRKDPAQRIKQIRALVLTNHALQSRSAIATTLIRPIPDDPSHPLEPLRFNDAMHLERTNKVSRSLVVAAHINARDTEVISRADEIRPQGERALIRIEGLFATA